jgi:hypothetical protein
MKKITLLVASIFLAGSMAHASENPVFSDNHGKEKGWKVDYRDAEPIKFVERGIEFYVFPTGDFDFNTRPDEGCETDYYFKAAGKRGAVVIEKHRPVNYGVKIERDAFGRVRRVGNTFINYDAFDRVSRIGTVYMRYNSFALTQIGGLRIIYDRKGRIIDMYGNVKGYRSSYYSDGYVYPRGNGNNSDYYYRNENDGDLRGDDRNDNMYYRQNDRTTKEDTTIKKTR